ncbi:MAG: DeoR/GlpR family DNA-binding transcription regulator [Actinomycetota bacterium]
MLTSVLGGVNLCAVLAHQRHDRIVDLIRSEGSMRVRDLADQLAVSDMTIRRDLDLLAGQGLIEKVHGGAAAVRNTSTFEPGFEAKQVQQQDEKQRIAAAAAELVAPGAAIGLSAGTTTWALAQLLTNVANLTVVTNATSTAHTLHRSHRTDQTIVLTGGIRTPSDALVGPLATAALERIHVDLLFLGIHGMDAEAGYTTPNLAEAEVNGAFIAAAERVIVVADHTKWGIRGLARIATLGDADVLITDTRLPARAGSILTEAGTEVRRV